MRICAGPRHFQAHRPFHVPYKLIRRRHLLVKQVRRALAPLAQQLCLRSTCYSIWRFYATLWRHMHPSYQTPIFRSGRSGYGQLRHSTRWMRADAWFSRKTRPFPVYIAVSSNGSKESNGGAFASASRTARCSLAEKAEGVKGFCNRQKRLS